MDVAAFSSACPGRANEDFATWNDRVVVLLDGAGMPSELRAPCVHGVAWFARTLGTALCSKAVGSVALPDALAQAIEYTADLHRGTCFVDDPLSPSATLAVLRLDRGVVDWLLLGDCTLVIERSHSVEAISDKRLAAVAKGERAALRAAPVASPERDRLHVRLVQAERALRNRPGGYWVVAADSHAAYESLHGSFAAQDVTRLALLSDGAARLVSPFNQIGWAELLTILDGQGPERLIELVRQAELQDSARTRWARSKVHDDATVAYIRL
ncbi:protein phosphatase 2C domain-containing protein [Streptomyces sp. NPDC055912]|uniref:protein phosphatase 2C domain-containing protein n=1 Tax=Streptomyces sp. NPDC055912 TaxID=3345660 RepID=UPI0035DE1082